MSTNYKEEYEPSDEVKERVLNLIREKDEPRSWQIVNAGNEEWRALKYLMQQSVVRVHADAYLYIEEQ